MDEQGDHATNGLGRPRSGRPTLFYVMSIFYHSSKIQGRVSIPGVSNRIDPVGYGKPTYAMRLCRPYAMRESMSRVT